MSVLLAGVLLPVAASGALAESSSGAKPAGAGSVRGQIAIMQAKVEKVARDLEQGTAAYEQNRDRLDVLLQQQFAAERASDVLALGANAAQRQLNAVARAAYVSGVPEDVRLAMSVNPRTLTYSLETVASLERVGGTSRSALKLLLEQRAATTERARQRDTLRRQAQEVQEASDKQVQELQQAAVQAGVELQAAQAELLRLQAAERARALRAEAARRAQLNLSQLTAGQFSPLGDPGGPPCSATADGQYANGFLPNAVLCPLASAPGQRLSMAAAAAFDQLGQLRASQAGSPLCVTDSYRDFAGQIDVFARKPSLAATPGRSQHGWGLALDLCGGAERFGSEMYRWLKDNAPQFGFIHPSWAEPGGGRPEPWHWEYVGA